MNIPDWSNALCAKTVAAKIAHPDDWFPEPLDLEARLRAQAICGMCPIKQMCSEYGQAEDLEGIWGGEEYRPRVTVRVMPPREITVRFTAAQYELYKQAWQLYGDGHHVGEIAEMLHIHKSTVSRYLNLKDRR